MVSAQEAVAYAEVVVYTIAFPVAIFVIFAQGFQKKLGWIYLGLFSIIRVAGAIYEIRHIHHLENSDDAKWAFILQSVGLTPLFMATYGLLMRTTDIISGYGALYKSEGEIQISKRSRVIQLMHLPTMAAVVLCVVGGIREFDGTPSKVSSGKTYTKIGIAIYIAVYLIQLLLVIATFKDYCNVPKGNARVFWAVVIANPFLAVRLLYSIIAAFTSIKSFSLVNGSIGVRLFLEIIEEFIVVVIYLLAGLTAPRLQT